MSSERADRDAQVGQDINAARDVYASARDLTVIHQYPVGHGHPAAVPVMRRLWGNVPARNPAFTGREGLLAAVREALVSGDRAVVQALHGMGGVGKTQLAAEYAHRFADSYDLVWWIAAEQAGLIGEQFAVLAGEMGCVELGAGSHAARRAVIGELRVRDRWLLVFDNAEDPEDVAEWLPGRSGHVLITSRTRAWSEVAVPVDVDVLARDESVEMLRGRLRGLDVTGAGQLADELGDLPLALAQAAGFMAETGATAGQYLELLQSRAGELLDRGVPGSYPGSLAAVTLLIADRLRHGEPAAAQLADICAFLAPEPIPEDLFTTGTATLPRELAARASDQLAWRQTLAALTRHALARVDQGKVVMHRLTQAILRDRLTPDDAATTRRHAEAVLAASDPGEPDNPASWPRWAVLMPHLLTADLAVTNDHDLRAMACSGCYYIQARGDYRPGHDLARDLRQKWQQQFGGDDWHTMTITTYLAMALHNLERYGEARDLDEDTLIRCRRVLGDDHPHTLNSANNLANDLRGLGEYQAARELDEDVLARCRRVLGDDHPDSLDCASNLAADLRGLGEYQAARELDQDLHTRSHQIFGDDHPRTLTFAGNLAADLRGLGEYQAASDLEEGYGDTARTQGQN